MFKEILDKLSIASKEAVVDGNKNEFDEFKEYMHIDRYVQGKLEQIVFSSLESNQSQLILISGNVGDGKSHMMSRLHKRFPEKMAKIRVRNDATESNRTSKSWLEELQDFLEPFSDQALSENREKVNHIVAINLGVLSSFLDRSESFGRLGEFVKKNGIIDSLPFNNSYIENSPFQFINLADYNLFTLKEDHSSSQLITEMLQKITAKKENNPFFKAYQSYYSDHPYQHSCAIRQNFIEISRPQVQQGLIDLIMYAIINFKLIISVRDLLNFIYDIIVPYELQNLSGDAIKSIKKQRLLQTKDLLYNKLFESFDRSELLDSIAKLDPNKFRSKYLDEHIFRLSSSERPLDIFLDHELTADVAWLNPRKNEILIKTFIRSLYLNRLDLFDDQLSNHRHFSRYLYRYYKNDRVGMRPLYKDLIKAIYYWNGNSKRPEEINVEIGQRQLKYNITQKINIESAIQVVDHPTNLDEVHEFGNTIHVGIKAAGKEVRFVLDINLYVLLQEVIGGYSPNKLDRENHTDFQKAVETITNLSSQGKSINFERIDGGTKKSFQLTYDSEFGYDFLKI
jgi:DNA phosphorothioation-dependent restriction protein DptF